MFFQFPPPPKKPTSQLKFWTAAVQNHIGGQTPFSTWGLTAGQLLLTAACWFELAVHRSSIFVLTLQYGESLFSFLRNLSTSSFNNSYAFLLLGWNPKTPFCSTLATYLPHPCNIPAPPLSHFCCSTLATLLLQPIYRCHNSAPRLPRRLIHFFLLRCYSSALPIILGHFSLFHCYCLSFAIMFLVTYHFLVAVL